MLRALGRTQSNVVLRTSWRFIHSSNAFNIMPSVPHAPKDPILGMTTNFKVIYNAKLLINVVKPLKCMNIQCFVLSSTTYDEPVSLGKWCNLMIIGRSVVSTA
jgi:hypothetical protein